MTSDPSGPSLGELRAASANLMAANLAASMFPHALKAAVDQQRYLLDAQTIGVDAEHAEQTLGEVRDELQVTGYPPSSAYRIAYRRLLEVPGERPPEPVRAVARQALQLGGLAFDPEDVDRLARRIAPIVQPAADFIARIHALTTSPGLAAAEIEGLKAAILALAETHEDDPE